MYDWGLGVEQNPARCWTWIKWARDGCSPTWDDVDDEVQQAYQFFRHVYDETVRKEGDCISTARLRKAKPHEKRKRLSHAFPGQGPEGLESERISPAVCYAT